MLECKEVGTGLSEDGGDFISFCICSIASV